VVEEINTGQTTINPEIPESENLHQSAG